MEGLNAVRIAAVKLSGEFLQHFPDRFWGAADLKVHRGAADVVELKIGMTL